MENNDIILEKRKADVTENYKIIRDKIAWAARQVGKNPDEIELVAVTKTVPVQLINHSISLGVTHIGENKVQEMMQKLPLLTKDGLPGGGSLQSAGAPIKISMIGHLQTNKAGLAVANSQMIQSVDSERLALEISRQAEKIDKVIECLVEVNIGREESKSGISPEECEELVLKCAELPGMKIAGLMTIPPILDENTLTREYFQKMNKLYVDICSKNIHNSNVKMCTLSMGMSDDFTQAILCGSNMVRIGSALYGSRAIHNSQFTIHN